MLSQIEECRKHFEELEIEIDLETLLDEISVLEEFEGDGGYLKDWYAVANNQGIIAYFGSRNEAFRFRLDYINRLLN